MNSVADRVGEHTGSPPQGLSFRIALALMRWGSGSARFGHQECYTPAFVRPSDDGLSIATRREFEDGATFFESFAGLISIDTLAGKEVLDLGCGHGGRTAYYALHGVPRSITGIEISAERAGVAIGSARELSKHPSMTFVAGFGEQLPFANSSFDAISSYDVFEHVSDLRLVLSECHRVLRPEGRLFALFPPYYGPRAHHLDFVTTLPFLHYFFSPRVLVQAANQILREQPGLRDVPLPNPSRSYLGREVLPRLNGTTVRDFQRLIGELPFRIESLTLLPFARGKGGLAKRIVRSFCQAMLRAPWPFTRDPFVSSIRCVLQKVVR